LRLAAAGHFSTAWNPRYMADYREAKDRRRFYLDRGLRKRSRGAGSDLARLMELPRARVPMNFGDLFGEIPVMVVDGIATRAYAPERMTKDIDFLVEHEQFAFSVRRLGEQGWVKRADLHFTTSTLGLYGQEWERDEVIVDLISTDQDWGREAFASPAVFDTTGLRVIPLAYLVLMKIDSARGIDQGDLTRMLGRLSDGEVEAVVAVVDRHSHDAQAADDVRQYALLGRLEWDRDSSL